MSYPIEQEPASVGDIWASKPNAAIDVLCPSGHAVSEWVERWVDTKPYASVRRSLDELTGGDFLFLVSFGEIVPPEVRERYAHVLVLHASDLPKDRGWSPHVWTILEGGNRLTVSLIDCAESVDTGDIWQQLHIELDGTETFDAINDALFAAELWLMDWALCYCDSSKPHPQEGEPTYRRLRTPDDSRISPDQSIADVFDLLRVCDPERYPAFFDYRGARYALSMKRLG